jgi:hypothetical protein
MRLITSALHYARTSRGSGADLATAFASRKPWRMEFCQQPHNQDALSSSHKAARRPPAAAGASRLREASTAGMARGAGVGRARHPPGYHSLRRACEE